MTSPRIAYAWETVRASWPPAVAAASAKVRGRFAGQRTFLAFALAVGAMNAASLAGNALAFRWVDPATMGVWHTLLLASSYATVVRLGVINGMGRELPYALGRGDVSRARRIASTSLAYNVACSATVALAFLAAWGFYWSSGAAWRLGLPAMAVVSAANLYLTHLQATFRSEHDFARLARVHWAQAAIALLLPFMVHAFGFAGLCAHAALQGLAVTGFAHALRPIRVAPRFEPPLARQLLATGLPLFLASYLQVLANGFDRVILLHRANVEAVGYYAPALAVLAAMGIMPGAISTYVYPRLSYALGRGLPGRELRRMTLAAGGASLAAGLPVAVAGWLAAPAVIGRFFPQYLASVPAVRWSLVSGLLWGLSPLPTLLGSLKAWRSLFLYIGLVGVARWVFPWLLSGSYEPLEGVALGNVAAAAFAGALSLALVRHVTVPRLGAAA